MPYSLSMTKHPSDRLWRDMGIADRAVRVAFYGGVAAFLAFWVLTGWLDGAAFRQPVAATGIYQFAYYHKGHTNYLTAGEGALDRLRIFLGFAAASGFAAGCWGSLSKRRAARQLVP